jgi:arylsulfatase A-like enzyme
MMVNWPGTTPAGKVSKDLIDSTDFFATFADAAGAKLPKDLIYDGRSFLPQLRGEKGNPRDTIFVQLARKWYVLEHGQKLTQDAELFDLSGAPWEEKLVPADTKDETAIKARARLSAVLAGLNPAGGILDQGDGTGRHANKKGKEPKDE